jgi:hypothetical protein
VESEQATSAPQAEACDGGGAAGASVASVAPVASGDRQRVAISLCLASATLDDGEFAETELHVDQVLALDPGNESGKWLRRAARESRTVERSTDARTQLERAWRTAMVRLQATAIANSVTTRLFRDPLQMLDDVTSGLSDSAAAALDLDRYEIVLSAAGCEPSGGSSFTESFDIEIAQTAVCRPAVARVVATHGANRNHYRQSAVGNRATCCVQGNDGRWIRLSRDWSAR